MRKLIWLLLLSSVPLFGQVSPQIQGAGAPANPCTNGGQDYVDQTNHVLYHCPSTGSNWANIGLGNVYPKGTSLLPTIVASLASYSQFGRGTTVPVSDGNSATDCTTGSGTTAVTCQYSGSAWAAVGGGGGSMTWPATPGVTVCTGTPCTAWGTTLASDGSGFTAVNAITLNSATFSAPGTIGGGTPGDGHFANLTATGSVAAGTAPTVCGSATGCIGLTEGSTTATATSAQDAVRADSTAHAFKVTLNNGAEFTSFMNYDPAVPPAIGATTANTGAFTTLTGTTINTTTNCAAAGSAANPSVAACSAAAAGAFSCATNASTGTCQVTSTAVGVNSNIWVQPTGATAVGTRLSVTCNTTADTGLTAPRVSAIASGSFTINLGTFSTNPLCFMWGVVDK